MTEKQYDVIIIGGGTGGVCAAAAFLNSNYKVALIEENSSLGGTTTEGLVSTWAEGINIDFHITMFNELSETGDTMGNLDDSWLPAKFSKKQKSNIIKFNPLKLTNYYLRVLKNSPNIDVYLDSVFEEIESISGSCINGIFVSISGSKVKLSAKYYIDSSGDGILCRKAAECLSLSSDICYLGRDSKERFNESLAMNTNDSTQLNEPSLFFKLTEEDVDPAQYRLISNVYASYKTDTGDTIIDDEVFLNEDLFEQYQFDLSKINIVKPDYIKKDGYRYSINTEEGTVFLCNPMSGAGVTGSEIIKYTKDRQYNLLKNRTTEYWKYIKYSLVLAKRCNQTGYWNNSGWLVSDYKYNISDQFARICGIRESYRIKCKYMLSQNDMINDIRECNDIEKERYIAIGCHNIDMHNQVGLSGIDDFNEKSLRPYGIKYDCLVPEFLSNVLIGCKAFGASQLAISSARIVKTISQIGWGCGSALKLCLDNGLSDTFLDDKYLSLLQSERYANFVGYLSTIRSK